MYIYLGYTSVKDDTISEQRTLAVHWYYYMWFSAQVAINLETKYNSTRIWLKSMKPRIYGICKVLLIWSHMFSNAAKSF